MNNVIMAQSPCFLLFPFLIPFCPPFVSLYLLGTLLAVIGSRPPWSQVARKLISPFPSPPHSLPTPWGFPGLNVRLNKTTSQIWLTSSRTVTFKLVAVKRGARYLLSCRFLCQLFVIRYCIAGSCIGYIRLPQSQKQCIYI